MRRFFDNTDDFSDLESELRGGRPEPRSEFVHELAARVGTSRSTTRRRPRAALALAFATVVLVVLGAFGGIGYAKSSVFSAAKSTSNVVSSLARGGQSAGQGVGAKPGAGGQAQSSSAKNGDSKGAANGGAGADRFGGGGPPWMHQYSRFVLVCYPFTLQLHHRTITIYRTIVIPRQALPQYVPPGTIGPCGFRWGTRPGSPPS